MLLRLNFVRPATLMATAIVMVLATVSYVGTRIEPFDPHQSASFYKRAMEKNKLPEEPNAAMDYYLAKRIGDQSIDMVERLAVARQQSLSSIAYQSTKGKFSPTTKNSQQDASLPTLSRWEFLGPGNVGGRTRALVINPQVPDIMHAAGVSGGIWRSLDAGLSWQPQGDLLASLAVVSLVFAAPSNCKMTDTQ